MFKQRVISGAILIAVLVTCIAFGGYTLGALIYVVSLIAYRELMKAFKLSGTLKSEEADPKRKNILFCFTDLEIVGYIGITVYNAVMIFTEDKIWLLVTLFGIMTVYMFVYVFTYPKHEGKDIAVSMFCIMYAPLMITFVYMITELKYGFYFVWLVFFWSIACDIFAYCVGMLFGKHKMAPVLSPKKSIEGAVGGALFAALFAGLYAHFCLEKVTGINSICWIIGLISIVGAVISEVGDLTASAIKRNQGIKDYGRLIPGHGGIMDRLDSILIVSPIVYLMTLSIIKWYSL